MSEPTGCARCCASSKTYCDRCDLLVGLPDLHVIDVAERELDSGVGLVVTVESPPAPAGCPQCGVIAAARGRRHVVLVDAPSFGRSVLIVWRKRTWRCHEPACAGGAFTDQDGRIARPQGLCTAWTCGWAIAQLRYEHASVAGLAQQLGTTWRTVWRAIEPLLQGLADDEARFGGVTTLGVDEHIWHHVSTRPSSWGTVRRSGPAWSIWPAIFTARSGLGCSIWSSADPVRRMRTG